ncbi:MAG: VanZ family protein [Lachnospiraceae bacterium]|nr:VanZ family protein [Lachnospiraceae bacterium]
MDTVVRISVYLVAAMVIFVIGSSILDLTAARKEEASSRQPEKDHGKKVLKFTEKHRKSIKAWILFATVFLIFYETIFFRPVTYRRYVFTPFYSYRLAMLGNTYYLREGLLNIFLYVPFGFMLRANFKKAGLWRILLIGCALSFLIETLQLIFCIGVFETDDIINNTLGALIGGACHLLGENIKHRILGQNAQKKQN